MEPRPERALAVTTNVVTLTTLFALLVFFGSTIRADETDDKFNEVNHRLLNTQIEAIKESLKSIRELAGVLVSKGDPRAQYVQAREQELLLQLRNLEQQKGTNAEPVDLRKLEKEFEAIDAGGGWWWLEKTSPDKRGPWYRLKPADNRFEHNFKDAGGNRQTHRMFTATYEVLGLDDNDQNVILIRMVYPRKGDEPGDQNIVRFDRTTGVIETDYGWYGEPKKESK
jgi:hypothetical protein